jgi:F-type H+-transporting ATPase subunit b
MPEESFFAEPRTWVAIAFIIFFVLFGKRLWQALAAMLDKRSEAVRAELAEAQRLRQEAEAMLTDARARREQRTRRRGWRARRRRRQKQRRAAVNRWRWTASPRPKRRRWTRCGRWPPRSRPLPPSRRSVKG